MRGATALSETCCHHPPQRQAQGPECLLADEAPRVLPDPADFNQIATWLQEHGLTYDELISQMGGSP
jgi:hypothetical protein